MDTNRHEKTWIRIFFFSLRNVLMAKPQTLRIQQSLQTHTHCELQSRRTRSSNTENISPSEPKSKMTSLLSKKEREIGKRMNFLDRLVVSRLAYFLELLAHAFPKQRPKQKQLPPSQFLIWNSRQLLFFSLAVKESKVNRSFREAPERCFFFFSSREYKQ